MKIALAELQRALSSHFQSLGLSPEHATQFSEVILEAEAEGNTGHGLSRIAQYTHQLRAGGLNARPMMRLEATRPAVTILHADGAPGPVAGLFAVQALAELAKQQGSAAIAVRGAGHSGVLSAYVGRLAQRGLVALVVGMGEHQGALLEMCAWLGLEVLPVNLEENRLVWRV